MLLLITIIILLEFFFIKHIWNPPKCLITETCSLFMLEGLKDSHMQFKRFSWFYLTK